MPGIGDDLVAGVFITAFSTSILHSRSIYNALDFLGDVGGLLDALKLIASVIISLTFSTTQAQYLLNNLFLTKKPSNSSVQKYT